MKQTRKRFFFLTAVLLTFSLLAVSCQIGGGGGKVGDKPVELLIWKLFEPEENLRAIMSAYSLAHSNVKFRYEKKEIATYEQDLLNALASGAGPDIFSIHNDWLPKYLDKLSPAPETLFTAREFQDTFVDVAKDELYDASGRLYAVPLAVDVLALYYNRDLLGSAGIALPPRTWEEVVSAVKKLTRQDRLGNFLTNGLAMGTAVNINRASDILSLLMLQNGTQIYNSARNIATLDREIATPTGERYNPGVQALEFYTQFANPAKETYTWNEKNNYSIDAFVGGQVALLLGYSYLEPIIRGKAPLLNFGIAPVPQIDLAKPKVNFANYFAEAVSKSSPDADTAWDFLKFATRAENLQSYYSMHKQAATRKDLISTQIADPQIGVFAEGALTARTFYKPDAAAVEAIFTRMIEDVILRNKSAQQAVSTANQLLGDLLR
ncbi:MAG: extracellular solute-binding protein [Candidatus Doudnabacteria bacterium]|nr:extracellular solute-binding protein [Candidatus Doudnabacteria bacterium]